MLAIFFSAALGALLDAEDAKADWVWRYVAVHCRPSEAKVSIELQYESNDELTPAWHGETRFGADGGVRDQDFKVSDQIDYGECLLAPATPVRVKVLRGVAMPYGMCGGDPETWLSVWVDQRKWLSRQFLDGRCPPALISRLEVTMAGVTICSAETLGSAETCSFKPASALAREPDLAEYPTGPRGPLPGTIVTEFAADGALCSSMVRRGQDKAGRQSWQVDLPSDAKSWMFSDRPREQWEYAKGQYEFSGGFSRQTFDIDNSGTPRVVYGFHPENHANDADIFFASPGPDFDETWPEISEQTLYRQSPYIFPVSVGTCEGHPCGPSDDPERGTLTLRHPSGDGTRVTFRFRYWHQTPFTWNGSTYFMASTYVVDQSHLTMVLKPKPAGFDETCLFRRVLDNY